MISTYIQSYVEKSDVDVQDAQGPFDRSSGSPTVSSVVGVLSEASYMYYEKLLILLQSTRS